MPVHINEAPTNYQYHADLADVFALTPDQNYTVSFTWLETWGEAFSSTSGTKVIFTFTHDVMAGDSWIITLDCPWDGGTPFSRSGVGAVASVSSIIQADADYLSESGPTGGPCTATKGFSAARWYVGINGATPTIVVAATIGAQTYTINPFDARLLDHSCVPSWATFDSIPSAMGACAGSAGAQASFSRVITVSCTSGWEKWNGSAWVEDSTTFEADPAMPSIGCVCPVALPNAGGGTLSYHLTGELNLSNIVTVTNLGVQTYTCPLGGSVTGNAWYVEEHYELDAAYVIGSVPDSFNIPNLKVEVGAVCNTIGIPTVIDYVYGGAPCKSRLYKEVIKADYKKFCFVHTGGNCSIVSPPLNNLPSFPPDTPFCGYLATRNDTWPDSAPCPGGGSIHMMDVQEQGIIYEVIATAADIHIERFNLQGLDDLLLVYTASGGDTIGMVQVAWSPFGNVSIVFELSGVVKRTFNTGVAAAGQWSPLMTVATGINPAYAIYKNNGVEFCAVYHTDRWKLYQLVPDAVAFTFVADIVVVATSTSAAGLEFNPHATNELVFAYVDAGTTKRLTSTNFGNTWSP